MIELYELIKTIDGERYGFSVPAQSETEARTIAQTMDCEYNDKIVATMDVCVKCRRDIHWIPKRERVH